VLHDQGAQIANKALIPRFPRHCKRTREQIGAIQS
jgi:hypothetical protein